MADILLPEDIQDSTEEPSEDDVTTGNNSRVALKQDGANSELSFIKEATPGNDSGMMLKQDSGDAELPYLDDLVIVNPDDLLPPVLKLEKYASSDIVFNRQAVVRNLLETLRGAIGNQDEVARVLTVMCNLAEDYEPSVRAELMELVPHLAALCSDNCSQLGNVIQQYLVPMIVKYLADINNQVRKRSQATLLVMVEQCLIDQANLEEKICPLILQLTESNLMDDHRTEAVTLMSKLAPLVGKELTEKLFLDRFAVLCLDTSFHVRKVCASSFGDFCSVVGREATEEKLLPKFYNLCEDSVWGVRKACAEIFMPVSCVCSMETRHKYLAPVYMNLLYDQSRWVRMAAFQALGPFISTFAEPNKTGLYYSKDGVLTIADIPNSISSKLVSSPKTDYSALTSAHNNSCCNLTSTNRTDVICSSSPCDNIPQAEEENFPTFQPQEDTHNSCTYRTVIEVNSPSHKFETKTIDATINDAEQDSKYATSGEYSSKVIVENMMSVNLASPSQHDVKMDSEHNLRKVECKEAEHLWDKCLYANVASEVTISNGEIVKEIKINNSTISTGGDNVATCVSNSNLPNSDNCAHKDDHKEGCSEGSVTVNGVVISSAIECSPEALNSTGLSVICKTNKACDSNNSCVLDNCVDSINNSDEKSAEPSCKNESNFLHSIRNSILESSDIFSFPLSENLSKYSNNSCANSVHSKTACDNIQDLINEQIQDGADDESAFNHFQYWRVPLPDVDLDFPVEEGKSGGAISCDSRKKSCSVMSHLFDRENYDADGHFSESHSSDTAIGVSPSVCSVICSSSRYMQKHWMENRVIGSNSSDTSNLMQIEEDMSDRDIENGGIIRTSKGPFHMELDKDGEPPPSSRQFFSAHDQDIVPPDLLLRYLSMTDASRAQTVDAEIARHCAYSLPAVALTLGRNYWPCLKETYDTLASDMQGFIMHWKVRRTLASSMHQLAVILGPDIAAKDLLPIFSSFVNDLDEVRIGILQHLSEFLAVLHVDRRREFLPRISEFLNTDNERNWRFRLILAEQLIPTGELYSPSDVREYLVPLSLALVRDKVCEVRLVAVKVMAAMMRRMSENPTPALTKAVLSELAEHFIHAPKWLHRQIYVYLCQEFVKSHSLPPDQFAEDAMPHLLYLCWDRVANVRIAIARCLAMVVWPLENFSHPDSPHRELLLQALHTLQSDMDPDVKFFANMVATHECSCLQHTALSDLPCSTNVLFETSTLMNCLSYCHP